MRDVIFLKSQDEIEAMSQPCSVVADVLASLRQVVTVGMTTREIEEFADARIRALGGQPAFKGYRGYPASICVSVNEQVVHGIPSGRRLAVGDLVSVDVGVFMNGFYGDAALTLALGAVSADDAALLRTTEEALYRGIEKAVEGNRLFDISHAIQQHVEKNGFSVVRMFVGHGIGREMHEDPQVPNFGSSGQGPRLKKGMTLAIEPMVNAGTYEVRILADKWTAVTLDGRKSAHFEHTICITEDLPRILTKYN